MRDTLIQEGQIFTTKMPSRFATTKKTLGDIEILAYVHNFVIFRRDGIESAIKKNDFIATYLEACKYRLLRHDFEYKGCMVVYDDGQYVIGSPISTCTPTADGAKAIIDFLDKRPYIKP